MLILERLIKSKTRFLPLILVLLFAVVTVYFGHVFRLVLASGNYQIFVNWLIFGMTLIFTIQGIFTLLWMLYAWENPLDVENHRSPKDYASPTLSFTALVPARHEQTVIEDTITAIARIDYPQGFKETLVICRADDQKTIENVRRIIKKLHDESIKIIILHDFPVNKPHSLNQGLLYAQNQVIAIFDAEDQPHSDIYQIINTVMRKEKSDIVQSGIQLVNFNSHWFSALNVLEYFFWFKSGLLFFSQIGKVTPLGGNTVFIKKRLLEKIDGWDEDCLTEDADIAIRATLAGAKTSVIYDERHTTHEETPPDVAGFIRQRTRWNQGFLQIIFKGYWLQLPSLRQKLTALYIFLSPFTECLAFIYLPVGLWIVFTQKIPEGLALFSFIPFYLLLLQIAVLGLGFIEFLEGYHFKFLPIYLFKLLASYYPYQLLLMVSSFRAIGRAATNLTAWEKTTHVNAHRFGLPVMTKAVASSVASLS